MFETRIHQLFVALAVVLSLACWGGRARAESADARPGVAGLNTAGTWDIELGFDWATDRSLLIAELQRSGLSVAPVEAGPEDVPRFLVGKLLELHCLRYQEHTNCRLSIRWEVLDTISGVSSYETITRVTRYSVEAKSQRELRELLLRDSVESLAKRERFLNALQHQPEAEAPLPTVPFKPCAAPPLKMPAQAPDAIAGSVVIDLGSGLGSGFFLNDEGLVLTAAHVTTQPEFKVRLANGKVYSAGVVRVNRDADVALVRVQGLTGTPCLRLADHEPSVGADLYAIGAPGNRNLSFSLTRGIVSGLRTAKGVRRIQTDTPISPGNSGGPLLGADGHVEAIVQAKIVRAGVEGVAFGLPSKGALAALGLTPGPKTHADLHSVLPLLPSPEFGRDPQDRAPRLQAADPQSAPRTPAPTPIAMPYAAAAPAPVAPPPFRDQGPSLPGYIHGLRWGGVGLAVVGFTIAGISNEAYSKNSSTEAEFEKLRTWNDLGWIAAGVGATAFTLSFVLAPHAPRARISAAWSPRSCGIQVGGEL